MKDNQAYTLVCVFGSIFIVMFIINLINTYDDMIKNLENSGKLKPLVANEGEIILEHPNDSI